MELKKILLLEDDDSIRECAKELLELEGFVVQSACNGDEGLRILRGSEGLPNLILLDLMMPVKDGFDFRREQRADPRLAEVPVVIWSAHGRGEDGRELLGVRDFVAKTADWESILQVVRRWCR